MVPDLLDKLTRTLSKPIRTECRVVYLMVELRKLMDRRDAIRDYPGLRLFCDWTVHTNIGWNRAAEPLMREFDSALESVKAGNGMSVEFLRFLSLDHFRDEFARFLKANELPCRLVKDGDAWNIFLELYSAVVSDWKRRSQFLSGEIGRRVGTHGETVANPIAVEPDGV